MKLYLKYKTIEHEATYNNVIKIEIKDGNLLFKQVGGIFAIEIPLNEIEIIRYNLFD